jgi:Glycosyl transferase family 2
MSRTRQLVAAHLILGPREEPFLPALLASIERVADVLIVNDNGGGTSDPAGTLDASSFARRGALIVERTPFEGFAAARNACLRAHARESTAPWVAFVDADEVHAAAAARIVEHLPSIPSGIGFVDGYTWHFFQSFDYYTSIERRMAFFRFDPQARWGGDVHERLSGVPGRRVALPYVYAHYGHTLAPRRHAEKGRHYSSLGAPGDVLREDQLDDFDVPAYFAPEYPRLMKFLGTHPAAALPTLERLRPQLERWHDLTRAMAQAQSLPIKLRNLARAANYEVRWRGRALDPFARSLLC